MRPMRPCDTGEKRMKPKKKTYQRVQRRVWGLQLGQWQLGGGVGVATAGGNV